LTVGSLGFLVTPALMGGSADMMLANFINFWAKDAPNCRSPRRVASILVCAVSLLAWILFPFRRPRRARPRHERTHAGALGRQLHGAGPPRHLTAASLRSRDVCY
jgi:hypothetical protein